MHFDFDLPSLSICLLSAALFAALFTGCVYCVRIYKVGSRQRSSDKDSLPADGTPFPRVSVIVYAHGEAEDLARNLPQIMEQDYPGEFEAIVVNEGLSEDVDMAVARAKAMYGNVYLTFTPDDARNLSRRKLGLTLGIKAAKGEVVAITDARAEVASRQWLRLMVEPMAREKTKEVVLGYGYAAVPEKCGITAKTRAFDMAEDVATWISSAMHGHPFRGCAYNLAYRKRLFFDAKGFAGSINMKYGDDDAFLSAISNAENTELQLASDSFVRLEASPYMRYTSDDRRIHAFTSRRLYKGERRIMAAGEWCLWLAFILSILGALAAGPANAAGWAIAAAIILAINSAVAICWRSALKALRTPYAAILIPITAALRPLRNIFVDIASRATHRHYIWQ